jgi:general stress protein 26
MDPSELLDFLRQQRLAVQASVSAEESPQAAIVGIAVTDDFEIVFDTLRSTRKAHNLRRNSKVALVIGGWNVGDERTVQYEGIADEPSAAELERLKAVYYAAYPDGPSRVSWPGLIYVRVRPTWVRYSNYNVDPPEIVEFRREQLVQRNRRSQGLAAHRPR